MQNQVIIEESAAGMVTFHFPQLEKSFLFSPQNACDALQEFMVKFGSGTRHCFEQVHAGPPVE